MNIIVARLLQMAESAKAPGGTPSPALLAGVKHAHLSDDSVMR
jgi:hypothetical protein